VVLRTFSLARAWRPAVVARLARTLGRTSVRTRGARCNVKRCIRFVLFIGAAVRFVQCSAVPCRAERDVKHRFSIVSTLRHRMGSDERRRGRIQHREGKASQFVVPRYARNAVRSAVLGALRPRSKRWSFYAAAAWSFRAVGQCPGVRPNTSFKRSANGRPPGPGLGYAVHCPSPGPGVLPLSPA
jgi:hypothetical protein